MSIKAIGFDVGGTLVNYNKPLNWSTSYEDAIKFMCKKNQIELTQERIEKAKSILTKYNTRVNPREKEISAQIIFEEIFNSWQEDYEKLNESKRTFFEFFQREAFLYDDVTNVLEYCKKHDILCAIYTDVAYGMEDEFSLKDIEKISDFIQLKLTSLNVGYRKPNRKGFEIMLKTFSCKPEEMIYVGDEKKDIEGAKGAGMIGVLINREDKEKDFGQDYTISSLSEIKQIIEC